MFYCKINELFKIFMCIKGKNTFCRSIWHPYLSNQEAFSFGNIFSGNQMSPWRHISILEIPTLAAIHTMRHSISGYDNTAPIGFWFCDIQILWLVAFCFFPNSFNFWLPQRLKSNAKSTQKLTYGYSERILRLKTKFEASIKKMHMPACGWSNFGFLTSVPWCGYFWKFFAIFRLKTNKYMAWGFQNGIMVQNCTFFSRVIGKNRKNDEFLKLPIFAPPSDPSAKKWLLGGTNGHCKPSYCPKTCSYRSLKIS